MRSSKGAPGLISGKRPKGSNACLVGRLRRFGRARNALVGLEEGVDVHVVFFEPSTDGFEGLIHRVGKLELVEILLADGAPTDHGLQIQNVVPILATVDED